MVIRRTYTQVWVYESPTDYRIIDGSPNLTGVGNRVSLYAKNGQVFDRVLITDIHVVDEITSDNRTFLTVAEMTSYLYDLGFFEHKYSAWQ